MKKLSLFEQVQIAEKEKEIAAKTAIKAGMTGSQMLRVLLPNYDQQPKSIRFHDAIQLHKGLRGGVRSGKTYTNEAEAIRVSYLNRPYYHLSISPSSDLAAVTVVPTLIELCEGSNLQFDWQKSNNLFQIIWGHQKKDIANILIFGAEGNFKGITAASGDMNEPFSIKKDKFLVWWERISHPKAKYMLREWGGTAEPDKMTWGHEYYKMESTKDIYLDTITTYDNKYLSKEYIRSLEDKYDPKMRLVYMLGECVNLSANKAFHSFDNRINILKYQSVIDKVLSRAQNAIVISYDFNVNPMTATEWYINGKESIQLDEYKVASSNTRELTELVIHRIIERYGLTPKTKDKYSFIITGDASGKRGDTRSQDRTQNDFTQIKSIFDQHKDVIRYKIVVPEKNPFVWDSVVYTNNRFFSKTAFICDNCVNTIEDVELVTWKTGADGFHLDKSNADRTHLSDTLRYALWNTRVLTDRTESKRPLIYTESSNRWR